jgi:phage pi2 protein 07
MLKWILLVSGLFLLTFFVLKIIKTMMKIEKDSNKKEQKNEQTEEYAPMDTQINTHSNSDSIVADMSVKPKEEKSELKVSENGFLDNIDDEFLEYSNHARKSGRRRQPVNFDLEGDMADEDLEYIPDAPDFNYIINNRPKKRKPIHSELSELPDELKVLMISNLFDTKF